MDKLCQLELDNVFQSTLPVKGATRSFPDKYRQLDISIHAPREGSDFICTATAIFSAEFQSTLPVKGATIQIRDVITCRSLFQSTLPVKGATPITAREVVERHISIHAPREGSDGEVVERR